MSERHLPPRQTRLGRVLSQPATTVADVLVPALVEALDVNEAVGRIDVNELLERIDLDMLLAKIDANALITRINVNGVLERVDIGDLIDRVDVDALIRRVDIDALLRRVDIDQLLDRVDVDRLIQRVDVESLVDRVDVNGIVGRVEVGSLVTRSTGGLLKSFLDLVRRQLVALDVIVMRLFERFRRGPFPAGPSGLVHATARPGEVSGRYAGPISRLVAFAVDVLVVLGTFELASAMLTYLVRLVFNYNLSAHKGVGWVVGLLAWWLVYLWLGSSLAGRTIGKLVVGLRVVASDGSPVSQRRSLVRVLVFPFSVLLLGLGCLMALFDRQRRALHDVAAGTCEVYDWGDRPAAMPGPLTSWLSGRGLLDVQKGTAG